MSEHLHNLSWAEFQSVLAVDKPVHVGRLCPQWESSASLTGGGEPWMLELRIDFTEPDEGPSISLCSVPTIPCIATSLVRGSGQWLAVRLEYPPAQPRGTRVAAAWYDELVKKLLVLGVLVPPLGAYCYVGQSASSLRSRDALCAMMHMRWPSYRSDPGSVAAAAASEPYYVPSLL